MVLLLARNDHLVSNVAREPLKVAHPRTRDIFSKESVEIQKSNYFSNYFNKLLVFINLFKRNNLFYLVPICSQQFPIRLLFLARANCWF